VCVVTFVYCVTLRRFLATILLALAPIAGVRAEDKPFGFPDLSAFDFLTGRADMSSGIDASGKSWSAYSTAVLSPLGPLHQDGLRLKLTGSYSTWSYDVRRALPYCMMSKQEREEATGTNLADLCNDIADRALTAEEQAAINKSIKPLGLQIDGEQFYQSETQQVQRYDVAVMPGYQASWRALVVKAFIGPAMESRTILPVDPDKAISGTSWGARGAIESWMQLSDAFWISADGGYFTGTESYSGMLRLGYQPLDWLTFGPELATFGDVEDDSGRAGGFVRLTVGNMEATLSGGMSAEYDGTTAAYGSAGIYTKF
jgi:hypothetical protein